MIDLLLLLYIGIVAGYSLFVSYQAVRFRRTYWLWPSLSGFNNRKTLLSPKWYSYCVGGIFLGICLFSFFLLGNPL